MNSINQISSKAKLFIEISGRLATKIITIDNFPVKVGRSPDCDVVLSDQTVSPEQLIIDCDENGVVTVTSLASKTDNPCKIGRKVIKHPTQMGDDGISITIGRITIKLSHGQDSLPKTIQLRPAGWLGVLTSPITAFLLFTAVVLVSLFEAQLTSIEAFEPHYNDYFSLGLEILAVLGYCVLVHLMRVRFSLVVLSLSLLLICKLIELQSPILIEQFEYALNASSNDLFAKIMNLVLYFVLWFVGLKRQLHLTWKKANMHALLICFPFFVGSFPEIVEQLSYKGKRAQVASLNGDLEPYNWHFNETKTLNTYFNEAEKELLHTLPNQKQMDEM